MRLNPDCIRDVLLTVEENTDVEDSMEYNKDLHNQFPRLHHYESKEVLYHIGQCEMTGFIVGLTWYGGPGCIIADLSPSGHEFLADIRSDTNWAKTKKIAGEVGSFSLNVLTKIAADVVTNLARGNL